MHYRHRNECKSPEVQMYDGPMTLLPLVQGIYRACLYVFMLWKKSADNDRNNSPTVSHQDIG